MNTWTKKLRRLVFGLFIASVSLQTFAQLSCPSLSVLAATCRNNLCQIGLGENASNCPEDCADKSTQLLAYYTQAAFCPPTTIYEPLSVAELQDTMRTVVSNNRKVRPAGTSHSATDIICADSKGDVIRSKHLKKIGPIVPFESHSHTVEIESGVMFQELQEHLDKLGFSHGLASTGYGGISIGGAIATGAHGSSLLNSSTISSYVVGLDVVGADGNITSYSEATTGATDNNLWKALKTNLGLLGFVARIRLKLVPQFNMNVQVLYTDEARFVNSPTGVADTVANCDYVFLTWFPGQDTVQYLCGNQTTDAVDSPHAQNRLFTPAISKFQNDFAIAGLQLGMCNNTLKCSTEASRITSYKKHPPLVIADSSSTDAKIMSRHSSLTGLSHRMITLQSEVFHNAAPAFTQMEYEGALPISQLQNALQYLKSIYDRDGTCQPLIGTIIRFDVADDKLLMSSNHARDGVKAGEKMAHLEFVEYYGYGLNNDGVAKWVNTPYTEIVKHLVDNYNYWPHWGKNDEWVFNHPSVMARNAKEREVFNKVIAKIDPYGVFSTEASRRHGFSSPKEGQNFAQAYFGNCATIDSDGDGINNCTDRTPNDFSGMYTRIDDGYFFSGSCRAADTWSEMFSNFGAKQEQAMTAGWDYESTQHQYHNKDYNWSPAWPNTGKKSWEALMSAQLTADTAGRYCFSQNNGATGKGIINGWNACGQIWVNKQLISEVGFHSDALNTNCVYLNKNQQYRVDIYNRHHRINVFRSFISHPQWCFGGESDCTPNRRFKQNDLKAISHTNIH